MDDDFGDGFGLWPSVLAFLIVAVMAYTTWIVLDGLSYFINNM